MGYYPITKEGYKKIAAYYIPKFEAKLEKFKGSYTLDIVIEEEDEDGEYLYLALVDKQSGRDLTETRFRTYPSCCGAAMIFKNSYYPFVGGGFQEQTIRKHGVWQTWLDLILDVAKVAGYGIVIATDKMGDDSEQLEKTAIKRHIAKKQGWAVQEFYNQRSYYNNAIFTYDLVNRKFPDIPGIEKESGKYRLYTADVWYRDTYLNGHT